jgi:hypothetical protein
VAGVDEVAGQQARPASELQHQPAPFAHGLEEGEDPGRHRVGVEAEPAVVHEGEIVSVVGGIHAPVSI